jgi:hypothetical protein
MFIVGFIKVSDVKDCNGFRKKIPNGTFYDHLY